MLITMTSMVDIPSDPKKIRTRLRSYERKLEKEWQTHGTYDDGAGKRYFVGPLYVLLGDIEGALESFAWYEREFPDDCGESGQFMCWALVLLRSGDQEKAKAKLKCCMLENRYVLPKLLDLDRGEVGIVADRDGLALMYLEDVPDAYYGVWSDEEKQWALDHFSSQEWVKLRARYFEIEALLEDEPRGERRSALVDEKFGMKG